MKIIVFGTKDTAQLANFYLYNDPEGVRRHLDEEVPYCDLIRPIEAFTVSREYIPASKKFEGKPVVPFEDVEKHYSPDEFLFFAPMTGAGMNKKREAIYLAAKKKGYRFISYVSTRATWFNGKIGDNCFILEDNTIQPFTEIGNNVVIWSGCHIGHHSVIKDHVFLTSHVVISGHCQIESYSWFGVNSSVRDGTQIKEGTLVGMSACVTKDTQPWSTYLGVPAKLIEGKDPREANP